jgi:ribonuclease HI
VIIFVDGSVSRNPGGIVGYGWYCPETDENGFGAAFQGGDAATNNMSEWLGVVAALIHLLGANNLIGTVTIKSDSELLVHQLNGEWRVKHSNLKPIAAIANMMIEELQNSGVQVVAEWIPREQNRVADELSRRTIKTQLKERRQMTLKEAGHA